jgi:hypothetical protein
MDDSEEFKQHHMLQRNLSWTEESIDTVNFIFVLF